MSYRRKTTYDSDSDISSSSDSSSSSSSPADPPPKKPRKITAVKATKKPLKKKPRRSSSSSSSSYSPSSSSPSRSRSRSRSGGRRHRSSSSSSSRPKPRSDDYDVDESPAVVVPTKNHAKHEAAKTTKENVDVEADCCGDSGADIVTAGTPTATTTTTTTTSTSVTSVDRSEDKILPMKRKIDPPRESAASKAAGKEPESEFGDAVIEISDDDSTLLPARPDDIGAESAARDEGTERIDVTADGMLLLATTHVCLTLTSGVDPYIRAVPLRTGYGPGYDFDCPCPDPFPKCKQDEACALSEKKMPPELPELEGPLFLVSGDPSNARSMGSKKSHMTCMNSSGKSVGRVTHSSLLCIPQVDVPLSKTNLAGYLKKIPKHCGMYHWEWRHNKEVSEKLGFCHLSGKLYVKIKTFEKYVAQGTEIPFRDILTQNWTHASDPVGEDSDTFRTSDSIEEYGFHEVTIPLVSDVPIKQPPRVSLKMFRYQLDALSWALEIEKSCRTGWNFPLLSTLQGTKVRVDRENMRFYPPSEVQSHEGVIKAQGGFYCDEVGLGKTLTMLALVVQNRLATAPIRIEPSNLLFPSKATLVLCPNHLTRQWKTEAEMNISPHLKVYLITTVTQANELTYSNVIQADLVIVSFQFLMNAHYAERVRLVRSTTPRTEVAEIRQADSITRLQELRRRKNPESVKFPILDHFHWHRIILDEGHEVALTPLSSHLSSFVGTYKWYVSGTPFPSGLESLLFGLSFIGCQVSCYNSRNELSFQQVNPPKKKTSRKCKLEREAIVTSQVCRSVRSCLFWRNTKSSVESEYSVPDIVEELVLLEQSDVEKGMYQAALRMGDELRMRQLCCHPQISDEDRSILGSAPKTLEEIRTVLLQHAQQEIVNCENLIKKIKTDIKDLEVRPLDNEESQAQRDRLIERKKGDVSAQKHACEVHRRTLEYLKAVVPKISQKTSDPCGVCLEEITKLTITICGHLFCFDCISRAIDAQHTCPACRHKLERKDLQLVGDENAADQIDYSAEQAKLTQKYGSKMAALIMYLRKIFQSDAKAIIFSQWDGMLHRVGSTLAENEIPHVYCKGNVFMRTKAIANFTQDSRTRVIMLSLENAASGLNLTEATHIILLDPIAGSKEEARAIERQAIGRAHRQGQQKQITVVRFIIKGTIEHDLYLRNSSPDHPFSSEVAPRESPSTPPPAASVPPAPKGKGKD